MIEHNLLLFFFFSSGRVAGDDSTTACDESVYTRKMGGSEGRGLHIGLRHPDVVEGADDALGGCVCHFFLYAC